MKIKALILIAALALTPLLSTAQEVQELLIGSPNFTLRIVDNDNFKPDGEPIKDRWGVAIYEVSVDKVGGGYDVDWEFFRLDTKTNEIYLTMHGDRALPEEGVYNLTVGVWNRGLENGTIVTKRSGNPIKKVLNYKIPEVPLVTPSDLYNSTVEVIEDETDFQ